MDCDSPLHIVIATPPTPGAIAILQLIGSGAEAVLHTLTGVGAWPVHRARLVDLAGIDDGLAVRLSERVAQIMPHGGVRVVQRLVQRLAELGVVASPKSEANDLLEIYPEAQDRIEAMTLLALSKATSPMAIDALLAQPARWRKAMHNGVSPSRADIDASLLLDRLITPPLVVLVGRPNVGKSTLSNALLGRDMSIAMDVPGTTRDYVAGRIDLGGLVVDWFDTPGFRADADDIESRAMVIANRLIERADLVIAMRDPTCDWPEMTAEPQLWVMNKVDEVQQSQGLTVGGDADSPLHFSAVRGVGLNMLVSAIRERLVPQNALDHKGLWIFDERLASHVQD